MSIEDSDRFDWHDWNTAPTCSSPRTIATHVRPTCRCCWRASRRTRQSASVTTLATVEGGTSDGSLLVEWNATRAHPLSGACVHELFEAQAARTPEAVAVVVRGEDALTYAELNARANRLARHLRAPGVGPEALRRRVRRALARMWWRCSACSRPAAPTSRSTPTYPRERLAFMLEDARAPVLLTEQRLLAALPAARRRACCASTAGGRDRSARTSAHEPARARVGRSDLAYVIYTSGSTGRPKGVRDPAPRGRQLPRRDARAARASTPTDRCWRSPRCRSTSRCSSSAAAGGRRRASCIADRETRRRTARCWRRCCAQSRRDRDAGDAGDLAAAARGGLARPADAQGARAAARRCRRAGRARCSRAAAGCGTCTARPRPRSGHCVLRRSRRAAARCRIGRPIANTRSTCSTRAAAGAGRRRRASSTSAATASRAATRPARADRRALRRPTRSASTGARLYRTGDLARFRPDGALEFLGRTITRSSCAASASSSARSRRRSPSTPRCARPRSSAREDSARRQRLVAYVSRSAEESPCAPAELRTYLRDAARVHGAVDFVVLEPSR